MIVVHKDSKRPEAEVTAVFGPDGGGKTHAVRLWQAHDPALIVLHGTNIDSWFAKPEDKDMLRLFGVTPGRIPSGKDVLGKIALVNETAMRLGRCGLHVVIDGHPLHKTAMNVAAGTLAGRRIAAAANLKVGTPAAALVTSPPLNTYFAELRSADVSVIHAEVNIPPILDANAGGAILQTPIDPRRTEWDPVDETESRVQIQRSAVLARAIQGAGGCVVSMFTRPEGIEIFSRNT